MDLPLMANADEIRARHYMIHLELPKKGWQENVFHGQVIIFLEPLNIDPMKTAVTHDGPSSNPMTMNVDNEPDFECILDCCDLCFDSVYEVTIPSYYIERFYGENSALLTFQERKEFESMRKFFR